jgi:hypothetical protein
VESLGQQVVCELDARVRERVPLARGADELEVAPPHDLALGRSTGLVGAPDQKQVPCHVASLPSFSS